MSDSVAAFLAVYPLLNLLMEKGHHFWEPVDGLIMDLDGQHGTDSCDRSEAIAEFQEYCRERGDALLSALRDVRLLEWNPDFRELLTRGIETILGAKNIGQVELGENALDEGLNRLATIINEQTRRAFGEYGSAFFFELTEVAEGNTRLVGKGVEKMIACALSASEVDLAPLVDLTAPATEGVPDDVHLDESTFSVRILGREPCFLGNTKRYRLLEALLQSANHYVSFSDLAERMGGDDQDADSLPVVKSRLASHLRARGYPDLARSIRAQRGHYGLFLGRGAIEM